MGIRFFGWGDEKKSERIARLEKEVISLEKKIIDQRDQIIDNDIVMDRIEGSNRRALEEVQNGYKDEIIDLKREISVLKDNFDIDVDNAKTDVLNKADKVERENERTFNKKIVQLEKEYADKIAKCDRALENDKASYKKYLRSEFNGRLDKAEEKAQKLEVENGKLLGENKSLIAWNEFCSGKQESQLELIGLVLKALPTVSANITTPEVIVNTGMPAAKSNGSNEQKKN